MDMEKLNLVFNYNMNSKRILLFFFIVINSISFPGCVTESEHNLGEGYYLLGNDGNTVISKRVKSKDGIYEDLILGKISDYDFDENFIILLRDASDRYNVYFENQSLLWSKQKGTSRIQYWIIEKAKNQILGPLQKGEYLRYREKLNIPIDLKLKEMDSLNSK